MHDKFLIIVGAQKCGTTTLYGHLSSSPYFASSHVKELHYFDKEKKPELDRYVAQFEGTSSSQCYLESTPSYLFLPDVAEKIKQTLAGRDVQIVVCTRNPVKRAVSHYNMNMRRKHDPRSFKEAFEAKSDQALDSYYRRGLYLEQIERYEQLFGRENVLVVDMDTDFANTDVLNSTLCDFVGTQLNLAAELPQLNNAWQFKNGALASFFAPSWVRRVGRMPMLRTLRNSIISLVSSDVKRDSVEKVDESLYVDHYRDEKDRLEKHLGRSLSWGGF